MKFDFNKDIPALKAGDRAAFNNLMTDYYGWSVKEARRVIRDSERAKDAAVTFWEQLPRLLIEHPPAPEALLGWMAVCVRNIAVDQVRVKQPSLSYSDTPTEPEQLCHIDPTARIGAMQDFEAVAKQLRTAQLKDVFWRLVEGAEAKDIAEECDITLKRAQNLISEVRAVITEQIGD